MTVSETVEKYTKNEGRNICFHHAEVTGFVIPLKTLENWTKLPKNCFTHFKEQSIGLWSLREERAIRWTPQAP